MNAHLPTLNDVRVFVIEDEEMLAWSIETELQSLGAKTRAANSLRTALERFDDFMPDLVVTDIRLPDGSGLELQKKWHQEYPDMPIIIMTAHGAMDSAIEALRHGAYDYIQKPFHMKTMIASVKRAAEMASLRKKVSHLTSYSVKSKDVNIIGKSKVMKDFTEILARVAKSKSTTMLIQGETGSGKELAARAIHQWSDRKAAPFVEINCASIPENLLESELFGYEKGAFTDARAKKVGLFELAGNGTIFLDEIGEMPLKLQAKLLRALEYRRFRRLGGTKEIPVSAQIVAATNRDLSKEVEAGRFRGDLYYRLDVLSLTIPPLRERLSDLDSLCGFLLEDLANSLQMIKPSISEAAMQKLKAYNFPGNVRELKNILERALVFYEPQSIEVDHIKFGKSPQRVPDHQTSDNAPTTNFNHKATERKVTQNDLMSLPESGINLDELEKALLQQALEKSRNNQTKASSLLGISRHTLRYRLEKHGLLEH